MLNIALPSDDQMLSLPIFQISALDRATAAATSTLVPVDLPIAHRLVRGYYGRLRLTERNGTRFDRRHITKHSDTSLNFGTDYFIRSADYNRYMDIQQRINLPIHRQFEKRGIGFAYPTQRLILERPVRKSQEFVESMS